MRADYQERGEDTRNGRLRSLALLGGFGRAPRCYLCEVLGGRGELIKGR